MKRTARSTIALFAVLVFTFTLTVSAGAEGALYTILATGTTQSFAADAVPDEDIQIILQAGASTASAINQQPWFFVAITNQDLMKEIGGSGMSFGGRPEGMSPPEGMGAPSGDKPEDSGRPAMPAGGAGSAKASLGDSPLAIIVYMDPNSKSPSPEYDCGLATQNMVIAASVLGYGVKIVSSPTRTLNGENHDALCEKLGVDSSMQAAAVLLIGRADGGVDATSGATTREAFESKTSIIK